MTSHDRFLEAFQHYMTSGDASFLSPYLQTKSLENNQSEPFLAIYRNGFFKAAIGALESNFPTLSRLLSSEHFFYLARNYIEHYPPSMASLVGYGMDDLISSAVVEKVSFIDYLKTEASLLDHAYLLDLCLLDQTWLQTLNNQNDQAFSIMDVQQLIESGQDLSLLPITLIASHQIISLSFDVFDFWSDSKFANTTGDLGNVVPQKIKGGVPLLFWRQGEQVQAKYLTTAELHFLQVLSSTFSLEQAESAASSIEKDFDLSLLFADLLNGQVLKAVT